MKISSKIILRTLVIFILITGISQNAISAPKDANNIQFLILDPFSRGTWSVPNNPTNILFRDLSKTYFTELGFKVLTTDELPSRMLDEFSLKRNAFFPLFSDKNIKKDGIELAQQIGRKINSDYVLLLKITYEKDYDGVYIHMINRWNGKVFFKKHTEKDLTWYHEPGEDFNNKINDVLVSLTESAQPDMLVELNKKRAHHKLPLLTSLYEHKGNIGESTLESNSNKSISNSSNRLKEDAPKSIYSKREHNDAVAVVIGNQNYSHKDIPTVKYSNNDATAVKKYLIESLGYKDGNIIFESDTTKAKLEMIFGTDDNHRGMLYNYVKAEKSEVFIYYSGHGSPDPNTNRAYLVPVDCNPVMMDLTAYPLDDLYDNLPKIEAKSVTVVLDACFSGGTDTGKWLVPNASPALIKVNNPVTAQNNITIFTSAKNNQVSSWYPEKQHSMFTYFFLSAVTGSADFNQDNQITYQEIYDFVADRAEGVPYYAKRLHGGRIQNPTMYAANKDAVFVKY